MKVDKETDQKKDSNSQKALEEEYNYQKSLKEKRRLTKRSLEKTIGSKTISKSDARAKLKEAKDNLELELITQAEYDKLKEELKPIIMSVSDDAPYTKESKQEVSSQTPKEKKKRSLGMKFLISFGLIIIMNIGIKLVNPNWGEESNYQRQKVVDKHFGSARYEDGTPVNDARKLFPKKETPIQFALGSFIAVVGLIGIYKIFKSK